MSEATTLQENLPATWECKAIGDMFEIQQGKQLSAKNRHGDNVKPFLRTANVFWNNLALDTVDAMNFLPKEAEKYRLREGDLLVCEGGDIGRTAIWDGSIEECYYQNHLHRLRPLNSGIDVSFFAYWMQEAITQRKLYISSGNKTTIPNLSKSRLASFAIPVPSLPEQQAIARVLRTVQEAIEVRRKELVLERERKAALMDTLFTRGTRGEPTKQTEIGEIPASWEVDRLGSYIEKPQYGYTDSAQVQDTGVRLLRITDIQENGVNWDSVPFSSCPAGVRTKYLLKENDIVIARIGATTGKAYFISECPSAVFASYLIRIRAKDSLVPRYLGHFLQSAGYWNHIDANKGGKLKGGVNLPIINSMKLPIPPKPEQQAISNLLSACDGKIELLQDEIALTTELFHALLEQLMSGKLSTQPLLERAA